METDIKVNKFGAAQMFLKHVGLDTCSFSEHVTDSWFNYWLFRYSYGAVTYAAKCLNADCLQQACLIGGLGEGWEGG